MINWYRSATIAPGRVLETTMAKLMSDPARMQLVAEGQANFVAGSALDEFWRQL